eukprot:jgi/Hompol1/3434/HPOL_003254-RA
MWLGAWGSREALNATQTLCQALAFRQWSGWLSSGIYPPLAGFDLLLHHHLLLLVLPGDLVAPHLDLLRRSLDLALALDPDPDLGLARRPTLYLGANSLLHQPVHSRVRQPDLQRGLPPDAGSVEFPVHQSDQKLESSLELRLLPRQYLATSIQSAQQSN